MASKFKIISPIDQNVFAERDYATSEQIQHCVKQAVLARSKWQRLQLQERKILVRAVLDHLLNNQDKLAEELTWQMGRPISQTPGEIKTMIHRAETMLGLAEQSLASHVIEDQKGIKRFIQHQPLGTVLILAPWNYPYLTAINTLIPALLAGNTVILKHATQTALCAERLQEAFDAANFPTGVMQTLHLDHHQVSDLIKQKDINMVSFTGSVNGGLAIQQAAVQRFIPVGLELGGKDPAYVRQDASIQETAANLSDGCYFNAGQSCCGIERIYVHQAIYQDFVQAFKEETEKLILGDPRDPATTLGPMVRTSSRQFVTEQLETAMNTGAENIIDISRFPLPVENQTYLAPHALINVDRDMAIMSEESFGPVVGIMAVEDDQQAIAEMNSTQYGLTASIWSNDLDQAGALAQLVEAGTCFVNRCDYLDPNLSWTGIKSSGRGCSLSTFGYTAVTQLKSFYIQALSKSS